MDDISFKDIRVLPGSLDLKSNFNKSLSDLLSQLQSGSALKGLVIGSTSTEEIIIRTVLGKFIIPNNPGLQKGDNLTMKLMNEGEKIFGIITAVNNIPSHEKPVGVTLLQDIPKNQTLPTKTAVPTNVVFDNTGKLPEQIKGNITYLNLSNINKASLLYKTLETAATQNNGRLSLIMNTEAPGQLIKSPLQVQGEVSDNSTNGAQLIKTNFGIITTVNTKMPVGQKMTLELISVNDQDTTIDIKKAVTDFIFHLNKNWHLVRNLSVTPLLEKDRTKKQEIRERISARAEASTQETRSKFNEFSSINHFLKAFGNHEEIKKLSSEFKVIKELFITNPKEGSTSNSWQSIMIPFYNGQEITDWEVKFSKPRQDFLRFLIDVKLETLGEIRIDGLIKFHAGSKIPVSFDLTMRSKHSLDPDLWNKIAEIFNLNQQISGIKGSLNFEEDADF